MTAIKPDSAGTLEISLLISRYPILAARIRLEMHQELARRSLVTANDSQDPGAQALSGSSPAEPDYWDLWSYHKHKTRIDAAFASNLPIRLLRQLIDSVVPGSEVSISPERVHLERLLRQAAAFEAADLPEKRDSALQHALADLLQHIVSGQKAFLDIAREWFTTADILYILEHRIGTGRIGGKAAGILLAYKILEHAAPDLFHQISVPLSYFIGADVFAAFLTDNQIDRLADTYYAGSLEEMRSAYPAIQDACKKGRLPDGIADQLRALLREVGNTPLIVRSSSLLEDSFNHSFAGKYASFFCPNQGSDAENLRDLALAVQNTYASVFNPDAVVYRRQMGLPEQEHMAVLLQKVQGRRHHQQYFPDAAGVAYSCSPFSWNPRLQREEGFTRLVMGLGTRAVERSSTDYARMVHLSHPQLRPEVTPGAIRRYAQRSLDVLDLTANRLTTLPVKDILSADLPSLRWLISEDDGDTVRPPVAMGLHFDSSKLILTFDRLLQRTAFVPLLKDLLAALSHNYRVPVDIEYAACLAPGEEGQPVLDFHLLQCRPLMKWNPEAGQTAPQDLDARDTLLVANRMVPMGQVSAVEYIVMVDPEAYQRMKQAHGFHEAARMVGRLNQKLEGHRFILIGPGRWGSSDAVQGVPVTYGDIYNASALIEITGIGGGFSSEPSYGTHFFQDLIEAQIFPLAVNLDEPGDFLNVDFVRHAQDRMPGVLTQAEQSDPCVRLIHNPSERPGCLLELVMDGERAVGYFQTQSANPEA